MTDELRDGIPPTETEDEFEIVDVSEAGVDVEALPGPDFNLQKFDEFGAPIRPPVKVRDGVRDTKTL